MPVTKKIYAEFTVPGLFFSEIEEVQVKSRNVQNLNIPEEAFGLRFFDILITSVPNGKKSIKTESNPVNYSPLYNIGTKICTKEEILKSLQREKLSKEAREGREKLLKKMASKKSKLEYALKLRVGGYTGLKKGELVLLLKGNKREVVKVS